jgi:hypothetical protein
LRERTALNVNGIGLRRLVDLVRSERAVHLPDGCRGLVDSDFGTVSRGRQVGNGPCVGTPLVQMQNDSFLRRRRIVNLRMPLALDLLGCRARLYFPCALPAER